MAEEFKFDKSILKEIESLNYSPTKLAGPRPEFQSHASTFFGCLKCCDELKPFARKYESLVNSDPSEFMDQLDTTIKQEFYKTLASVKLDDESESVVEKSFEKMVKKYKKYEDLSKKNIFSLVQHFKDLDHFRYADSENFCSKCIGFQSSIVNWLSKCIKGTITCDGYEENKFKQVRTKLQAVRKVFRAYDDGEKKMDKNLYSKFSAFLKTELEGKILKNIKDKKANPPTNTIQKLIDDFENKSKDLGLC